ncbi:RHTO0S07e07778g1_1 [Rhodotorula toruloides]|uniref:RHTO0S07e07778g1_1 n=2 Tax=Rhodotorula toruloides TaxID=5286 RepID=A0A061B0S1_RHOTO|nr:uncharacterized protein RHTO_03000 [Rhodotorula toruloides NP11]EMS25272.1 hypothetical protein RHTO_03000 [Rhodotorula toruloides NP11]CDR43070.1 RHTO0S07e07778g1_1 [Rhodotorula toruloides]
MARIPGRSLGPSPNALEPSCLPQLRLRHNRRTSHRHRPRACRQQASSCPHLPSLFRPTASPTQTHSKTPSPGRRYRRLDSSPKTRQ